MAARSERRGDPRILWPQVRSIVMLGVNYGPDHDPTVILAKPERAAISVYAKGDDYHDVIKKRLKALARWLIAQADAMPAWRPGDEFEAARKRALAEVDP